MFYCVAMHRRIIIVSFGTKDGKAGEEIAALKKRLSSAYSIPISYAYSSHHITRHVCKRMNFDKMIKEHEDEELLIMPLLIQKGGEYEKISSKGLRTAPPLLGNKENIRAVAAIINNGLKREDGLVHLLIAHGDEKRRTEEYDILASILRDDVKIATLKGERSYRKVNIKEERIHIIPFLLSYGHHARHDIKEDVVSYFKKEGKIVSMRESGITTTFPELEEIFRKNLEDLIK